ncbi:hypothetical protein [Streptomyces sp. SAJ15]|uniref:hypothetical protein n=1 Tax=Streptomyces sp. SAJ15 TaxID=2011095 RepID=UPI0011853A29|nr:hypothetical protein [Streptomyces sp. SAJ15]TVL89155.1 hypothetical protein CD790_28645 [Streptomyces sp. SAJ15]
MSDHRYEELPRSLRLTHGVRREGEQFAIGALVFRGAVQIGTTEVLLSINDASVINAQLTRLLNEQAFPGMEERARQRRRERWGY